MISRVYAGNFAPGQYPRSPNPFIADDVVCFDVHSQSLIETVTDAGQLFAVLLNQLLDAVLSRCKGGFDVHRASCINSVSRCWLGAWIMGNVSANGMLINWKCWMRIVAWLAQYCWGGYSCGDRTEKRGLFCIVWF